MSVWIRFLLGIEFHDILIIISFSLNFMVFSRVFDVKDLQSNHIYLFMNNLVN